MTRTAGHATPADVGASREYHLAQTRAAGNSAAARHGREGRWLAVMLEYLGTDTRDWPDVTRQAAESLPLEVRREVLAGCTERGAGGAAPSYLDSGTLTLSGEPDPAQGRHLRDDEKRSHSGSVLQKAIHDEVGGVDPHDWIRTRAQLRPWEQRHGEWLNEIALRSAIEAATGRNIMDEYGVPIRCRHGGQVQQHRDVTDAFRFLAYTCHRRGRCPHCGRTYGEEQGEELASLVEAAATRAGVEVPASSSERVKPLAWGVVLTFPKPITEHLGRLAEDPFGKDQLRAELRKVSEIAREAAARLGYGARAGVPRPAQRKYRPSLSPAREATPEVRADLRARRDAVTERRRAVEALRREVTASVNVHWWASETPTRGWHWHAHMIVPNATRGGKTLRDVGTLSEKRMQHMKRHVAKRIREAWPELAGRLGRAQLRVKWYSNTKVGRTALGHRARYDARHPLADLLKLSAERPEHVYQHAELEPLRAFAVRVERLQRLKTRRYVGWMQPGERRKLDVLPEEVETDDGPVWLPVENAGRLILGFTEDGVRLYHMDAARVEHYSLAKGRDVLSASERPGRRWCYLPGGRDPPEPSGGECMPVPNPPDPEPVYVTNDVQQPAPSTGRLFA